MSEPTDIRIVSKSYQYKGAADADVYLQLGLNGDQRDLVEGDRTVLLNLEERFYEERQKSNIIRVSGKVSNLFNNSISGYTNYVPFGNNLYYLNAVEAKTINAQQAPPQINAWRGYVQYDEFSFYRTTGIPGHIPFVNKSASTYNWTMYLSYAYSSDTTQVMRYENEELNGVINFVASDGIPFVIKNREVNGKTLITFYCGCHHNLSEGDYVKLSFSVNGKDYFPVYSFGDENFGSELKVFSIYNIGYASGFVDGTTGTLKRITDINNTGETTSKYYIRKHKILTSVDDYTLTKLGFENIPFKNEIKLEYSALTPNNTQRTSIKNGSQATGYSFEKDIDITNLIDNNKMPVRELFVSIIQKGYMGWFNKPFANNYPGLSVGWEFNFLENSVDQWWDNSNLNNKDLGLTTSSYSYNSNTFYYNNNLNVNDVIEGDFCEWNDFDMKETLLCPMYHKYSYNPILFINNSPVNFESGYLYKPHHSVKVRDFSSYVEFGVKDEIDNIPNYAYYSQTEQQWRWRDLYPYGFIDDDGYGVDNPFTNNAHYPFKEISFKQVPPMRNINQPNIGIIVDPIIDDCE